MCWRDDRPVDGVLTEVYNKVNGPAVDETQLLAQCLPELNKQVWLLPLSKRMESRGICGSFRRLATALSHKVARRAHFAGRVFENTRCGTMRSDNRATIDLFKVDRGATSGKKWGGYYSKFRNFNININHKNIFYNFIDN
jgi:hypothetical protein